VVTGKETGVGLAGTLVGDMPVPVKVSVAVGAGSTVVDTPFAVVYTFQTPGPVFTKKLCKVCELPKLSNVVTAVELL
jgi:hypothetical protein